MADQNIRKVTEGFRFQDQRDALQNFLNMCFTKVGLASGDNSKVKTGAAPVVMIGGYLYSFAAVSASGITSCAHQASNTTCIYAFCLNSNGSVKIIKGTEDASASVYAPGSIPTSLVTIGLFKVSMASDMSCYIGGGASGTNISSLSATSTTIEWFDVAMIPQGVILST
jgi:hypothetical protein